MRIKMANLSVSTQILLAAKHTLSSMAAASLGMLELRFPLLEILG